ncbi:flagellar biosynthetic protein FliR [Legionella dresdenensis]|uniref:Flagellar biosynthetic protein FliR n=1 Tax=Legionella dresdenensis TaxID=450200 RepID=A0ABV8CCF5_9GAMM
MTATYSGMIAYLSQLVWPLMRVSGLFLTMPLISTSLVSPRIRIIFAFALAFLIAPHIPERLSFLNFTGTYVYYIAEEILLGLTMGFILQMVFQIFIIGGQIVAMQAGLGFAIMVDPASRASVPLMSQMYQLMVGLTFLALDGHLAILEALLFSFEKMPVGEMYNEFSLIGAVITFSSWMIKESVLVSLPAILSMLLVTLSFGVMTRVAPQLNIFSLGFPITLLMGMIIVRVGLPGISSQIEGSLEQGLLLIKELLG